VKILNFTEFCSEVKKAFRKMEPWSHIRFGDGEGIVMGYPEYTSEGKCKKRWHKWLGHSNLDIGNFALEIRAAAEMADIIGTPCDRHQKINQDWRNVLKYMKQYHLLNEESVTCCMDWTVKMHLKNCYHDILDNREDVTYISCRDVREILKNTFNIKKVTAIHLPPQHYPCKGDVLRNEPHYPDIYNEIMDYLSDDLSGKIFLIGAGGLGKIYCNWVKQHNGVALDIGSLFDGWAGLVTRSYLKGIKKIKL